MSEPFYKEPSSLKLEYLIKIIDVWEIFEQAGIELVVPGYFNLCGLRDVLLFLNDPISFYRIHGHEVNLVTEIREGRQIDPDPYIEGEELQEILVDNKARDRKRRKSLAEEIKQVRSEYNL